MAAAALPSDLSPWGMFLAADWVVKAVMIGLACAAVTVLVVWLAKRIELQIACSRLRRAAVALDEARDLSAVVLPPKAGIARDLVAAAQRELAATPQDRTGALQRIDLHAADVRRHAQNHARAGLGLLATIAASAPFVGLFGTVWGIMNSFIGISRSQTTNLAVVAPGIAEALLATAIGLAAAIPAVILHNQLTRSVTAHRLAVDDLASALLRLLSRDGSRLEPQVAPWRQAAE
jgi:biopolymer transport protein ExbB